MKPIHFTQYFPPNAGGPILDTYHRPDDIADLASFIVNNGGYLCSRVSPSGRFADLWVDFTDEEGNETTITTRRNVVIDSRVPASIDSLIEQAHEWISDRKKLLPRFGKNWEAYRF